MKITFLGTGTSVGVPMIGCECPVCQSSDPRNRRSRASVCLDADGTVLVVDTSPDFREQALARRIPRVDAVLFTHSHADHIFGFDDIRRFNTMQDDAVIPAYAEPSTLADLRRIFNYIGSQKIQGLYRPLIEFREIQGSFRVGPITVEPIRVLHGSDPTLGFLFEHAGARLGYCPDCHEMPAESLARFKGVDVMVLDALRHRPHGTHLTVTESVRLLEQIGAGRSYLIHLGHDLDHAATQRELPQDVFLSYDGLVVDVE